MIISKEDDFIIKSLEGCGNHPSEEYDGYPRFICNSPVTIISESEEWDGMIVDISLGGIRIDSNKSLSVNQKVNISFLNIIVLSHVRYKIDNLYGLSFDELKTEDTNKLIHLINGGFYFPIR